MTSIFICSGGTLRDAEVGRHKDDVKAHFCLIGLGAHGCSPSRQAQIRATWGFLCFAPGANSPRDCCCSRDKLEEWHLRCIHFPLATPWHQVTAVVPGTMRMKPGVQLLATCPFEVIKARILPWGLNSIFQIEDTQGMTKGDKVCSCPKCYAIVWEEVRFSMQN